MIDPHQPGDPNHNGNEQGSPAPHRLRRTWLQALIAFILLAAIIATGLYLTSDAFRERMRQRVVSEIERDTGGSVELRSFRWNLARLQFQIDDLTIHGTEPPGAVPYAHVESLTVRLKIIALLERQIGIRYLDVRRPVVHLIVRPDGTTNQPTPKLRSSDSNSIATVFDLAIDHAIITDGEFLWNEQRLPFDLDARDIGAVLKYNASLSAKKRSYDATLRTGQIHSMLGRSSAAPLVSRADAQFSIFNDHIEIPALHWATNTSHLDASGNITDFREPHLALSYRTSLSAADASRLVDIPALRAGTLRLEGAAHFNRHAFRSNGILHTNDLAYRAGSIDIAGVDGAARFSIDLASLSLTDINAQAFGGHANGDVTINDWSNRDRRKGSAKLHVASVGVERALRALLPRVASSSLRLVSNASGSVDVAWTGAPSNADVDLALDIAPQPNAAPSRNALALTGSLDASYRARTAMFEVRRADLNTAASHLSAQGTLENSDDAQSATAQMHVDLTTSDFAELQPAIAASGIASDKLPFDIRGDASFAGYASGSLHQPHLRGHVTAENFDVAIPRLKTAVATRIDASASGAAPKSIHFDSAAAEIDYTPLMLSLHGATLHRSNESVAFDLTATLASRTGGQLLRYPLDRAPFHLRADLRDAAISDLQTLTGTDYPVTGTGHATLDVSGTVESLTGSGAVQFSDGSIYGEPYRSLTADLRIANSDLQATHLALHDGGTITGSASYDFISKRFTADLAGQHFDIAKIDRLHWRGLQPQGMAHFTVVASGSADAPVVNANLGIDDVIVNGEKVGAITAKATTRGDELQLTSNVSAPAGSLAMTGTVRLRDDFPADLNATLTGVDVDPLLRTLTPARLTGHSQIAGTIHATGPLAKPRQMELTGDLSDFHASIETINLQSDGPVRFDVRDQTLHLQPAHIVGEGTDLHAAGTLALVRKGALESQLDGTVNLKLLQTLNRDVSASGVAALHVTTTGTATDPDLQGEVDLNNASIALIDLPNGLSEITGRLVFTENRLQIQSLTARTGGGRLTLGGMMTYSNGTPYFDITARGREIRIRYPQGVSSQANANLRLSGTTKGAMLSGNVVITKFEMTPDFDFALYVARSKQAPAPADPNSFANKVRLNVRVSSSPELSVETSLAKLSGDVDLSLRGTPLNPVLLGRVNIAEGDIYFNGTKYHLDRGDVIFTNPLRLDPVLNVDASTTIRDYDITLGFHGPLDHMSTTYRSEPPLPTADIVSLLAFQRTTQETTFEQGTTLSESAQNQVLGQALNAAVSSRIQKLFGISKVKIDPQGLGPLDYNRPSITIEQQIQNNVTVTFITDLTQTNQQVIQVEYNVNRNVSIVGVRDQYGVLAIDVRLRQRKR